MTTQSPPAPQGPAADLEAIATAFRNAAFKGYRPDLNWGTPIQPGEQAVAIMSWLEPKSAERTEALRAFARLDDKTKGFRARVAAMARMNAAGIAALLGA